MAQEFGGTDPDPQLQALVDQIGMEVVNNSAAKQSPYRYEFHLLGDRKTINAFALPGGQIFITRALLDKLRSKGQLAGVLGHEVAHVVARHGAEHMAKAKLTQGLTGAAVMATYDPENPSSANSAMIAQMIGGLINLKYGRDDEIESDKLGVRFVSEAGYDPRAMIEVMKVLKEAGGGGRAPEFFSSHPNPDNRIGRIQQAIKTQFPNGLPNGLKP
jgi:predicted Zn-dependent protease